MYGVVYLQMQQQSNRNPAVMIYSPIKQSTRTTEKTKSQTNKNK